jgi:hypothetical protein
MWVEEAALWAWELVLELEREWGQALELACRRIVRRRDPGV